MGRVFGTSFVDISDPRNPVYLGNLPTHGAFGASWRAFGFQKNLNDGYFDPSLYTLTEITGRWQREFRGWTFLIEAAPGLQTLTGVDASASARARGVVSYRFAPGREVAASGGLSTTGLQVFSSEAGTYRYRTLSVSVAWTF